MLIKEISKYIENWAPPGAAWEKDNVGFQVGSKNKELTNIMICLDASTEVLKEAKKKNCNLIISHHPLLFNPIKKINPESDEKSKAVEFLIKNDITLFSAHTNLDFTKDGVSFALANKLKLTNIEYLEQQESSQYKLVVFVPENDLLKVSYAIFEEGGGIIGEYRNCSFRQTGKGTFKGSEFSNPKIGERNKFEEVSEVRLEVVVDKWKIEKVVEKMIEAHPYEQPAYDVYVVKNRNENFGAGTIGELPNPLTQNQFLQEVSAKINSNLRYSKTGQKKISKVAVCGGSGSNLLKTAVRRGADAFITADVKYHTFQDAENRILLIDAGHYETEVPILNVIKSRLEKFLKEKNTKNKVFKFSGNNNPVKYL